MVAPQVVDLPGGVRLAPSGIWTEQAFIKFLLLVLEEIPLCKVDEMVRKVQTSAARWSILSDNKAGLVLDLAAKLGIKVL